MTCTVVRSTSGASCRMSLSWDLCGVFLTIRMRLWIRGRRIAGVKCHSHPIISRVDIIHTTSLLTMTLITQLTCLSGFSTLKSLFFLPFLYSSLQGHHYEQPIQRSREFGSFSWGVSIYTNSLEFFCRKSTLPQFIQSFICISMYSQILASIYIILWVLIHCQFIYFVVHIIPILAAFSVSFNIPLVTNYQTLF